MIYTHEDGTCTMSAQQVWRPGVYENARVARIAQRRDDADLQKLMDAANGRMPDGVGGTITEQDLRQ